MESSPPLIKITPPPLVEAVHTLEEYLERHQELSWWSYGSYAGTVLHRPHLHTLNSTLEEVFCYLDGRYDQMAHHNGPGTERATREYWGFQAWIENLLAQAKTGLGGRYLIASLRERYADDTDALAWLAEEYRSYWESLKPAKSYVL